MVPRGKNVHLLNPRFCLFSEKGITDLIKDHDMRSSWIMQVGLKSNDMSI